MSKEIFLYSEDKKYKCGIELAESTDRFGCPDHSMIVLFEEREDGTYVIAKARDMLLETQKDKQIAKLKAKNQQLQQQLKDNTKQVCEKISKNIVKYLYGGNLFDIKGFKEFLDQIENEKEDVFDE